MFQPLNVEKTDIKPTETRVQRIAQWEIEQMLNKYNVNSYNPQKYLNSLEMTQEGLVWWDKVHLRSFGQQQLAEKLKPQVLKALTE